MNFLFELWGIVAATVIKPVYVTAKLFHARFGKRLVAVDDLHTNDWEDRISYRHFFAGLPALLGLLAIVVFASFSVMRGDGAILSRYVAEASNAVHQTDYDRAVVCLTRLNELQPKNPEFIFELGRTMDLQGRSEQAAGLIAGITTSAGIGHAPAHLWTIRRRLKQSPGDAEIHSIEKQLILLREDARLGTEAAVMLAELYLRTDRANFVAEEPKLREVARGVPRLHLLLLQAAARRGLTAVERREVEELIRVFRGELELRPHDVDLRVQIAQALTLHGELPGAVVALREGLTLEPQGPFGKLLAELLVSLAGNVQKANRLSEAEQAAVYLEALDAVERYADPSPATDLRRAQFYRLLGDLDRAEQLYLAVVGAFPETRIELGELYLMQNRPVGARQQWQRLYDEYGALRGDGKPLTDEQRRLAAQIALRLARYSDAVDWLSQPKVVAEHRPLLAEAYVLWWDSLRVLETPLNEYVNPRLDLLVNGLAVEPRSATILFRLLAAARRTDRVGELALKELQQLIVNDAQKAPAYVVLGSAEYVRGNVDEALKYLEQAYRLDPQADVTLNNLAWVLATAEPPDLERALKLADAAVELTGGAVRTRETRLRILVKLQRWDEALADVEACESFLRGSSDFHRVAALVYEKLNLRILADEHRRSADEIEKK